MNIVNDFLDKIETLLDKAPSDDDFDDFNELEIWFLDNSMLLDSENEEISDLGDLMQDEIAEMSYMADNSQQRKNIRKIYDEMKRELTKSQRD